MVKDQPSGVWVGTLLTIQCRLTKQCSEMLRKVSLLAYFPSLWGATMEHMPTQRLATPNSSFSQTNFTITNAPGMKILGLAAGFLLML